VVDTPVVAVGQVWEDSDPRSAGRRILITVVDLANGRARGMVFTQARNVGDDEHRTRWISLKRFRPHHRGYRLLSTPDIPPAVTS
jgi:hypothetical protein